MIDEYEIKEGIKEILDEFDSSCMTRESKINAYDELLKSLKKLYDKIGE